MKKFKTNVTLCFSAPQALLAAKSRSDVYKSVLSVVLMDIGQEGMQLIEQIVTIYHNYHFRTQVLVASVRHPLHVIEAALLGADVCTDAL